MLRDRLEVTTEVCPVREILERIGGKWSIDVLMALGEGPRHFASLERAIGVISRRMLTLTLRGLERDGLVSRTVIHGQVPTVIYENTSMGEGLRTALEALARWSCENAENLYLARERYDCEHSPAFREHAAASKTG